MKLGEIMTTRVVTVELDDSLATVKEIFDALRFHHLLVIGSDKKLCGVISDRDLLRAISPYVGTPAETTRDSATLKKRAHQIMTRSPATLRPDASPADAVQLLLERRVSCIPIVDEEFRAVGIVSWRDILRSLPGARGVPGSSGA
jgi:acetoin utilization protein AcuB